MSAAHDQVSPTGSQKQCAHAQSADSGIAFAAGDLEEKLRFISYNHTAVIDFQTRLSAVEHRSVLNIQPEHIDNNLTQTTLGGQDMVPYRPYVFTDDTSGSVLAFYHLGKRLAGHAGIVHGGIPAVLLDEVMGRACFPRLAGKIAVTTKLDLEYKSPIPVGSNVLIRADTREVQGRKAWVDAVVEDAVDGRIHVKATALFIEPRWAKDMAKVL